MIGISKMYSEIIALCGIKDFEIVNPYNSSCDCEYLLISKGYFDKVHKLNPNSKIIEINSATFIDLIESLEKLKNENIGDVDSINQSIEQLKKLDFKIKNDNFEFVKNFKYNIASDSKFIRKILDDLGFKPKNGMTVKIIPDYNLKEDSDLNGVIILKTHRYDLKLVKRIENRYLSIITSLNNINLEKT
uniref:Segregation and condensation protein B n=1 Tax=Methanococcus maripaludis (strain C6 / ATCC BAA-1332) TaxID=444158 RepID=A9A6D1_METM6